MTGISQTSNDAYPEIFVRIVPAMMVAMLGIKLLNQSGNIRVK